MNDRPRGPRSFLGRTPAQWFRDYHLVATGFWMLMLPIALWRGWASTVTFVSAISIWSLVSTEWGAWQGSRAEVMAEEVKVSARHADVDAQSADVTVGQ
jgi:hypothetical protein